MLLLLSYRKDLAPRTRSDTIVKTSGSTRLDHTGRTEMGRRFRVPSPCDAELEAPTMVEVAGDGSG